MSIPLKGKIYKTVVCPVALYGSASWPATTKHEQTLRGMEMKMLGWSLGPHATQPAYHLPMAKEAEARSSGGGHCAQSVLP